MKEEFTHFWRGHYHEIAPLGYVLRAELPDRWGRYHSLPRSKRYAETVDEYDIVLSRANQVASYCLGDHSPCWLVASHWCGAPSPLFQEWHDKISPHGAFEAQFRWVVKDDEFETEFEAFAAPINWCPGQFDDLIKFVADDLIRDVVFVSRLTGTVFAPYDGGGDMIFPTADKASLFKDKFALWLSRHPKGL